MLTSEQVRKALNLSYHNARSLRKLVARIPCKAPFMKTSLAVAGIKKKFDVLYRDPKLVLEDLWSRIELKGKIATVPERRYTDQLRKVRLYSEFHTGDWMWRTQVSWKTFPMSTSTHSVAEPVAKRRNNSPDYSIW